MIDAITLIGCGVAIISAVWLREIVGAEWHEWGLFIAFAFMFSLWHADSAAYFPAIDSQLQLLTVIVAIITEILVFLRVWKYENYEVHH